jgi:hypothetical protein
VTVSASHAQKRGSIGDVVGMTIWGSTSAALVDVRSDELLELSESELSELSESELSELRELSELDPPGSLSPVATVRREVGPPVAELRVVGSSSAVARVLARAEVSDDRSESSDDSDDSDDSGAWVVVRDRVAVTDSSPADAEASPSEADADAPPAEASAPSADAEADGRAVRDAVDVGSASVVSGADASSSDPESLSSGALVRVVNEAPVVGSTVVVVPRSGSVVVVTPVDGSVVVVGAAELSDASSSGATVASFGSGQPSGVVVGSERSEVPSGVDSGALLSASALAVGCP